MWVVGGIVRFALLEDEALLALANSPSQLASALSNWLNCMRRASGSFPPALALPQAEDQQIRTYDGHYYRAIEPISAKQ
jgi:hypothetical protein